MALLDFPTSPTPGQTYAAPNGVTYIWDNTVGTGVWLTTTPAAALSISSPGTITGTAAVNATLTYATGTATGGTAPYTYAWVWKKASDNSVLQTGGATYVIGAGLVGDRVYVELTATDSAAATATASTANYPAAPATIQPVGITGAVAPTTIPGTANFTWADAPGNLTATGCIEFSVNGGPFTQTSTAVAVGNTITTQWLTSPACGGAADGTTITGTLTDGTLTSTFNLTIDKVPNAFTLTPATETTTPSTVTTSNPSFTVGGINAPAFIWGTFTTLGGAPQYTVDNGTNWNAIPTTPGTATVDNGQTVKIRFTTGATAGSEVYTLNVGASLTAKQSGTFTVTVASSPFPTSSFTPAGAPNASPASVNTGTLFGTASCASWADGSTSLTSTGGIQFQVNGGGYGTGPTAVANGNTVDVIWDPAAIAGAADGATLTGTLTNGVFTNTYSITVSRAVTGLAFTDTTGIALSTATTSNIVTPAGFNVPVSLTYAGTATNPLTTIGVSVQGGAFNSSPQTVNPGQTLQIQGTTGATNSTAYGVTLTMGSGPVATDTWTATTTATTPSIQTPTIQTPANGATGVGTASGITITGDTYTPLNGAGAVQTSSLWEVYKDSYPLTSTNAITLVTQNAAGAWATIPNLSTASGAAQTKGVAYGNGVYVIGSNTTAYSPDLTTWTAAGAGGVTLGGNGSLAPCVTFAFGKFWGITSDGTKRVLSSPDGATWTTSTTLVGSYPGCIFYGGGRLFVTSTDNTGIYSTTDGVSWSQTTGVIAGAGSAGIRSIAYSGTTYVGVGHSSTLGSGVAVVSSDGINWSVGTGGFNLLDQVAYGNGVFVARQGGSQVYTSTNGSSWVLVTTTFPVSAITFDGAKFYAYDGSNVKMYESTNGSTWTLNSSSVTAFGTSMGSANGRAFLLASGGNTQTFTPASTTLTIAGCQTDGFLVGDTVVSDPAAAGPATITSVDNTSVTVTPSSTNWAIGQKIKRDPASYSAVTGSPFTVSASPFTSLSIAKPPLAANTKYWARVQYATTNATAATSSYSAWSGFTTGDLQVGPLTLKADVAPYQMIGRIVGNGTTWVMGTQSTGSGSSTPYIKTSTDLVTWTNNTSPQAGYFPNYNPAASTWTVSNTSSGVSPAISKATAPAGVWSTATAGGIIGGWPGPCVYNGSTWGCLFQGSGSDPNISFNWLYTTDSGATWNLSTRAAGFGNTGGNGYGLFIGGKWIFPTYTLDGVGSLVLYTSTTASPVAANFVKSATIGSAASGIPNLATNGTTILCSSASGAASGAILKSTDNGATWTTALTTTKPVYDVCFGGGLWVAVGASGSMWISTDTVTWTDRTSVTGTTEGLVNISHDSTNSRFIIRSTSKVFTA